MKTKLNKTKEALVKAYVADVLTGDLVIDPNRMPPNIRALTMDYFRTLFPTTPLDALCLAIYAKVAQILAIPRFRLQSNLVKSEDSTVFINLYGILFMPSGSGKDRVLREINKEFLYDIRNDYRERYEVARRQIIDLLMEQAAERFANRDDQRRFVAQESPREFTWEISSATAEGLSDWMSSLDKSRMGGVFWSNSEFEDFILSIRQENKDLMSSLKDAYDGKSAMKVIKGEKFSADVGDVPTSLLVHTSYSKLTEGVGADRLDHFFTSGFSRRSFICFPEEIEPDFKDKVDSLEALYEQEDKSKDSLYKNVDYYKAMFRQVYDSSRSAQVRVAVFSKQADIKIRAYRDYCEIKHNAIKKYENESVLKELLGRSWKTLRLAALVALLEHPGTSTVEVEDVDFAIYLAEVWGNQFVKFCQTSNVPAWMKLIQFLTRPENINRWIRKTKLVQARVFEAKYTNTWLAENIPLAKEFLAGTNSELQDRQVGRVMEFRVVKKEVVHMEKMQISTSDDITTGYKLREVDFYNLHNVISSSKNYAPAKFNTGYRSKENWMGGETLFILDIDSGWTLEEAKKFIEENDVLALLITTRNHQKVKHEGEEVCDRFRIIMPALTAFKGTADEYKDIMKNLMVFFDNKPDQACSNVSRSYYGNPQGQHWYSEGKKMFDWSDFKPAEEAVKYTKQIIQSKQTFNATQDKDRLIKAFETFARTNLYKGNRDNTIYRMVQWAKDEGLNRDQAREIILEYNARLSEPLSDYDIVAKINRAYSEK